jgi:hypothetical protein
MTRIFIENKELDLSQSLSQQITFAVDDLQNMDSKATSFTKTIVLSGTGNNNKLLGNIFEFGNSNFTIDSQPNVGYNFNASKSAQARIEIDGLPVMKGVMRLLEIIIDGDSVEYEVALFGELGGFISTLGAKKLTDLDFSEYNHTYNITAIQTSWNNQGSGYFYPLIDYGNVSPLYGANFSKQNFYFTAFRPAFFVREYLNKIITAAGYTWQSEFFDTDYFKSLIIPNNQSRLKFNRSTIFQSRLAGNYTLNDTITHNSIVTDLFSNVGSEVFTYTAALPFSGKFKISISGNYTIENSDINDFQFRFAFATIRVYKNGTLFFDGQSNPFGVFGGFASTLGLSTPPQYSFGSFYDVPVTFNTGNTFDIRLEVFSTDGARINTTLTSSTLTITTDNPILVSAQYNDVLLVNSTLPANILQKDFFTSILKMFNIMVTEDIYIEKRLKFEPYVDFYDTDRTTFLDWSDKIDRSQVIKIKPMSEINARFYTFKYKQDNDFYNEDYRKKYEENYGDRVYDNQLEFTKDTSTTEVIFSPSVLIGYNDRDKIFPAIYKKTNDVEENIEHNIRIMFSKKITGRTAWKIYNQFDQALVSGLTSYGYAGHVDNPFSPQFDLNFGVPKELYFVLTSGVLFRNLFNIYYSPYFAEITDKDSRLVTAKMKFTPKDIFNLDFGKLIYNDGVLYRLTKIKDYSDNEVCEVEMLRVNYLQYDAPYFEIYTLGQPLNGGYIVYIDSTGRHGLIAPDYNDVEQAIVFEWGAAVSYCDAVTIGGYSDWRIGTKDEMSFIDINNTYIPNFIPNNFWTGTEANSTEAFRISFNGTGIGTLAVLKTDDYYALPIKSF